MVFKLKKAPYIKLGSTNVSNMMFHVVIALIPAVLFSIYLFGLSALLIILTSVASMLLTEYLVCKFRKVEITTYNYSTIVTGLIYALILPDQVPLYIVVIGAVAGILFGKLVFGGLGANIFNPAGFGRVFVVLSFGSHLSYTLAGVGKAATDAVASATPLAMLKPDVLSLDVLQTFSISDLFIGTVPGSLGETSAIAILIGGAYMFYKKVADWRKSASMIGIVAFLALIVALIKDVDVVNYVLLHVFSGGLLFGAIFMITDPVTAPVTGPNRVLYGLLAGALTFIIRMFGAYPEGVVFSILIVNMFAPAIDYHKFSTTKYTKTWFVSVFVIIVIFVTITVVGVLGM